jgi:hypothetical protein
MQTHRKSPTTLAAYAGIYQIRGDLGLKLALLLLTVHVLSARITSELKVAAALPAHEAPKPSLKLFVSTDGSLRLDPTAATGVSTAEFQAAVSNLVARAGGQPTVIALCVPQNQMTKALVGAGLAVAQIASNTETVLTINPEP